MERIDQAPAATVVPRIEIEPEAETAARSYIEAIVAHDRLTEMLGPDYQAVEAERLWAAFEARFTALVTGAYAKPHREALRIALSGI